MPPNNRGDFRTPPGNRWGIPQVQYPTPNVEDVIIQEELSIADFNSSPLPYGTPHPQQPAALLVAQLPGKGDNHSKTMRRIYANPRSGQDVYNAAIKFTEDDPDSPVYIRSYLELRPDSHTPRPVSQALDSIMYVQVTAGGGGYVESNPPEVQITGTGTGATARAIVVGDAVNLVALTNGGAGYTSATVQIASPGVSATAEVILGYPVASANLINGGTNYSNVAQAVVTGTGGYGTGAAISLNIDPGGSITSVSLSSPGQGYVAPVTVQVVDDTGSGAEIEVVLDTLGSVVDITLLTGGSGYVTNPSVVISNDSITGTGSGATANAVVANGEVVNVAITGNGSGYSGAQTVAFSGENGTQATAIAALQPTGAVLTHQEITPAEGELGALFDRILRVYTTLPGPEVYTYRSGKGGTLVKTIRQLVPPDTLPGSITGTELGETVQQLSTTQAERTTTLIVNADGTTASGFPIYQTKRRDEQTGVLITTDHFNAPKGYTLPPTFVGGTRTLIAASYPDWKQPNTNNQGYGSDSYNPPHYVLAARATSAGEDSDLLTVQIEHAPIPIARAETEEIGYTFPGILLKNEQPYFIPNNYAGRYQPPWNIGEDQLGGYRYINPRSGSWQAKAYYTYSLGPREDMPDVYRVTSTASSLFKVGEKTIHGPIQWSEELTNGEQYVIEDIPSSTPPSYDPFALLVVGARERRWAGEIYEQRVLLVSEGTPISAFPDPVVTGYYIARKAFRATPAVFLDSKPQEGKLYVKTVAAGGGTGTETINVTIFGKSLPGETAIDTSEQVTAKSTVDSSSTTTQDYVRVTEALLEYPAASDSVEIWEAVDPDYASLKLTAFPDDGDKLIIGRTGSTRTYVFKTTLSGSDQIKIGGTLPAMATNIVRAIRGTGLGTTTGTGTLPHAALWAEVDSANTKLVRFTTLDPTANSSDPATDYTYGIFESNGTTPENFGVVVAFASGGVGERLASIPAGVPYAYWKADFATNTCLVDESNDNDRKALPTLPAGRVIYTDWMEIPSNKSITLRYGARGNPPMRIAWQKANSQTDPTGVTQSVQVTNGSATLGAAISSGYIGQKIIIPGDTRENEVTGTTSLLFAYGGTTGTKSATITPLTATRIANAAEGKVRNVSIGTPGTTYIRLKITNLDSTPGYRPIFAEANWLRTPND